VLYQSPVADFFTWVWFMLGSV